MSRVANKPVPVPKGVEVALQGQHVAIKGSKGSLELDVPTNVTVAQSDSELQVKAKHNAARAMAGTMRSLLNNMVIGVSQGFEKKLTLVGVGYRAQAQGSKLNLALGYSHPIDYAVPAGIKVDTPSQTEIVVSGIDKQQVGQVAAEIRAFRLPEPYKGKGVRYSDEHIVRKETKKK